MLDVSMTTYLRSYLLLSLFFMFIMKTCGALFIMKMAKFLLLAYQFWMSMDYLFLVRQYFFDWEKSFERTFEFNYLHKMEHNKKCLGIWSQQDLTVVLTCWCISWSVAPLCYSKKGNTVFLSCNIRVRVC